MNTALRLRSFAKINLALAVLGRRPDGFHEIRTVFQTIDLWDELEIRPSPAIVLRCPELASVPQEENTVWRAATALAQATGTRAGAEITLKKRIPAGAGLGGGSGNAAAVLLGLRQFWNLGIPAGELRPIAAGIGSDVPFFLEGGTALGIGRGEEIYPLPEITPRFLVIVHPGVHISTAAAYGALNMPLTSWRNPLTIQRFCGRLPDCSGDLTGIFNDFENSILSAYPDVAQAKEFLTRCGATGAMLSGSGSSVFGFFSSEESALAASRAPGVRESWRVFPAKTLSRAQYLHSILG